MSELSQINDELQKMGENWEKFKTEAEEYHKEIKKTGEASADALQKIDELNKAIDSNKDEVSEIKKSFQESKDLDDRLAKIELAIKRNGGISISKKTNEISEVAQAYKDNFLKCMRSGGLEETNKSAELQKAYNDMLDGDELQKALAVNLQPDGGLQVPLDMSGKISTVIYESSPMRQVAAVQQISTDSLSGPIDENRASFQWTGETATRDETNLPQRGMWNIPTHEASARVLISQKLLEDSIVDQEAWAIEKIAQEFALGEATSFITGVGGFQPRGIMTYPDGAPASGKQPRQTLERIDTGVNGDLTDPAKLVNMVYALKKAYRANARWAFAREGIEKVRLLLQDGKFTWQPGLQAGEPDRLLGFIIEEFNDIADYATGALVGIFADFAKTYQIVDRIQMSMLRDPFTQKPFVELYARKRVGGDVTNFDACKLLEASA